MDKKQCFYYFSFVIPLPVFGQQSIVFDEDFNGYKFVSSLRGFKRAQRFVFLMEKTILVTIANFAKYFVSNFAKKNVSEILHALCYILFPFREILYAN